MQKLLLLTMICCSSVMVCNAASTTTTATCNPDLATNCIATPNGNTTTIQCSDPQGKIRYESASISSTDTPHNYTFSLAQFNTSTKIAACSYQFGSTHVTINVYHADNNDSFNTSLFSTDSNWHFNGSLYQCGSSANACLLYLTTYS